VDLKVTLDLLVSSVARELLASWALQVRLVQLAVQGLQVLMELPVVLVLLVSPDSQVSVELQVLLERLISRIARTKG
jgi:hypothetical protein